MNVGHEILFKNAASGPIADALKKKMEPLSEIRAQSSFGNCTISSFTHNNKRGGKGSLAKRKERPSNNKKLLAPPIVVRHNKKSMPSSGNLESAKNRRKFLEKGKKMRQTRLACGSARRGRLSHYRIVSKRSQTVFVSNKRRKRAQTQTEGGGRRAEP